MLHKKLVSIFFLSILFLCCKEEKKALPIQDIEPQQIEMKYASGFTITEFQDYKILNITNPWPKSDKQFKYALVPKENQSKITLNKDDYDGIITIPIETIVVTSTTHIPALEHLGVENRLIGFPGCDYVSSEKTRARINTGQVRELGSNEGINTEILLELRPDLVMSFGVEGSNKSLETINASGISVIYNGDWVEKSPLAKAEWIKCFGILFDKSEKANMVFNTIETNYMDAKKMASEAIEKPSVLCGAMYKDIWYLPNGTSPEAQILKDANTNYLWSDTEASGSLALSFETVFEKAQDAELWISPSYYGSYDDLKASNDHYTKFKAFQSKNIYTFSNTKGETGGVLYYELGVLRPDLVLKDMIKVCHPNLLPEYKTTFFKPLK
ncbi:ABC transporter substrate-binding protein [Psychroserpens sp. XS_ASV72]|uniref:ABC transporter substrate-binding protein n=1 Tax=Psychroserpens sp. XS_ASV72 TaxID=3241293 RepID=UPI003512A8F8